MSEIETASYFYANKMGRIVFLAMEEIMGRNGVNAALNMANLPSRIRNYPPDNMEKGFPFEELSQIQSGLEKLYGRRGGQGLALRSGRACFKYGLREFGPLVGCTDLAFRLLPLDEKLSAGAKIFAGVFNDFSDQRVRIEEDKSCINWIIERCPVCWKRHTEAPVCHLAVGLLQEAMYWVSGGKFFSIEEVECVAKGNSACVIVIDKQPME